MPKALQAMFYPKNVPNIERLIRIIAGIARLVRDLGIAEELAQDALVTALEQWPATGIPANPGAWLTAAGNSAVDISVASGSILIGGADIDDVALNQNDRIHDVLVCTQNRKERTVRRGDVHLAVQRV